MSDKEIVFRTIYPNNLSKKEFFQLMEVEKAAFPNPYTIEQMKGTIEYDGCTTVVVEEDDKIIGFIIMGYDIEGQEELLFIDFAIMPEHQGEGLGTKLLYVMLSSWRVEEDTQVVLTVKEDNVNARKFYVNLGFENDNDFNVLEREKGYIVMSIMYKDLLENLEKKIKDQELKDQVKSIRR